MTPLSPRTGDAATAPRFVNDIASSILLGAGAVYVRQGLVTASQEQAIVGGLLAALSVGWSYLAAHPSTQTPLDLLLGLARQAPAASRAAYDTGLNEAEAALLARITPLLHAQIAAHAGLLAGPADALADRAVRRMADTAVAAAQVPHLSV